jgi:hypothetical protein
LIAQRFRGRLFVTGLAFAAGIVSPARAQAVPPQTSQEPTVRVQWIDHRGPDGSNPAMGDRTELISSRPGPRTSAGLAPIPWWRSANGREQFVGVEDPTAMRTAPGEWLEQPIPVYAPLIATFHLQGQVSGNGTVVILDGEGGRFSRVVGQADLHHFEITANEISTGMGRRPSPRLTLRLEPGPNGLASRWSEVEAFSELPCPTEAALRAEVIAQIDDILKTWFERGIDDVGPRKTGFLTKMFDAVTGETLVTSKTTGFHPMYQALLDAVEAEDVPAWHALLERMLTDYFALQMHPDTGLPRNWAAVDDVPDDTTPIEIALPLGFLIDVADHGPQSFRQRARAAATKIGDTVLRKGLLPDGTCAASYVPRDGTPNLDVSQLRRLDVPLQLVRLTTLTGDARYAQAAREPLAMVEFTNRWAGTWDAIDPGFDDDFGHYAARAARAACAMPEETLFRRFALEGWKHYDPIWRDALRYGGNIAADQVRCWKIGVDLAHLDPLMRPDMGPLLWMAARSHFKGEQYDNGAWGDVTVFDYKPQTTLQVGDLPGAPQNLLSGLASIYVDELGLRTDEIRGMYTAVLRSSITQYKKKYGFISDRTERKGPNPASGSLRMMTGLVEMLRALNPPK